MISLGATDAIFSLMSETRQSRVATFPTIFPKSMFDIPILGPLFFSQPISTWVALILPFIAAYILYKTRWGLNVRAVGDNPKAAATAGLSVIKIKYQTVILSGIFAALGGCRTDPGRGRLLLRRRHGRRTRLHCYGSLRCRRMEPDPNQSCMPGLGAADALQLRFQTTGSVIPYQFLQMLPYVVTIVALTIMVKHSIVPKTWGSAYDPKDV